MIGEILDAATWGAQYGEALGVKWAGASVAARIRLARRIIAESRCAREALDVLYETCGVGMLPTELVPTAMGIVALYGADCTKAVEAAVNMGATRHSCSMVGAVTGALCGIGGFRRNGCDRGRRQRHQHS